MAGNGTHTTATEKKIGIIGSGLAGIRDRVEAAGGRLTVSSPAGTGTRVEAVFP